MSTDLQIFGFERDFADTLRCIPMSVRMKLDECGIKLSLRQWSRFNYKDRYELCYRSTESDVDKQHYRQFLKELIRARSNEEPVFLATPQPTEWKDGHSVPTCLQKQILEKNLSPVSPQKWATLTPLQRFSLIKLCRSGHENHNLPAALREFTL
ncbi:MULTISPECIES: nitrate reductase associated protein [Gluconobacter]|uniref:nitrate reductase associated protein n=1 Tax=Gluconobacter TaxID=441 RepID=UPI0009E7A99C|nr:MULTISPECIES: nitrate reductase associated protein [Gluconobacter]MBF0852333.1 nitrate reductase maturation protein NarM [Gluconobacter sp. R75690]MBF0881054.1 nitrate reductase maturation protein NarM [Gluconobacter sp. R75828]